MRIYNRASVLCTDARERVKNRLTDTFETPGMIANDLGISYSLCVRILREFERSGTVERRYPQRPNSTPAFRKATSQ